MKIKPDKQQNAIGCYYTNGPIFGLSIKFGDDDIWISHNSNINRDNYSNLGRNYQHPQYAFGTNEAQIFLAGSYKFQLSDIEVYQKE